MTEQTLNNLSTVRLAWDISVDNDHGGFLVRSLRERIERMVADLQSQGFNVEHVCTVKDREDRIFADLSTRESEVLALLAQGKRAADIAVYKVVSITTIRTQIRSILRKLNVGSQLEAVAIFNRRQ